MKIVSKCLALQPLSSEFKDNLCNPIHIRLSLLKLKSAILFIMADQTPK